MSCVCITKGASVSDRGITGISGIFCHLRASLAPFTNSEYQRVIWLPLLLLPPWRPLLLGTAAMEEEKRDAIQDVQELSRRASQRVKEHIGNLNMTRPGAVSSQDVKSQGIWAMPWLRLPRCGNGRNSPHVRFADGYETDEYEHDGEEETLITNKLATDDDERESMEEDPLIIIRVFGVLLFIGTGVILYGIMEGWSPLTALYFVVGTVTAVGCGDLHPATYGGQLFTAFYAVIGICIVFRILLFLISLLLDRHESFLLQIISTDDHRPLAELRSQANELKKKKWTNTIIFSAITVLLYATVGTCFWSIGQGLSVTTSLYLVVTTLLTIGYGDIKPSTLGDGALAFSVVFVLTGVSITAYIISKNMMNESKISKVEEIGESLEELPWATFLSVMLLEMDLVDEQSMMEIRARWEELRDSERRHAIKRNMEVLTNPSTKSIAVNGEKFGFKAIQLQSMNHKMS
eukprot:jgi/Bigna1/85449/estExt_fgenesh1_pg.C_40115